MYSYFITEDECYIKNEGIRPSVRNNEGAGSKSALKSANDGWQCQKASHFLKRKGKNKILEI